MISASKFVNVTFKSSLKDRSPFTFHVKTFIVSSQALETKKINLLFLYCFGVIFCLNECAIVLKNYIFLTDRLECYFSPGL